MRSLLMVLSLLAAGEARTQAPLPFRISMNVDFVVLETTVRDAKGFFVSGLGQGDFEVYENGARQNVSLFRHEDTPVTLGLVVDHSGSMRRKLDDAIAAAGAFVKASNPEDRMFVVNFNEKVTLGLPAGVRLSSTPEQLVRAVANTRAEGKTALYDALVKGLEHLETGGRDKKAILAISDGGDNASAHTLAEVLKLAGHSSAAIYAIGIFDAEDPDRNPEVLKRLARETGGEAFFPAGMNEVTAICERIAKDIRNQYTLGYSSTNAAQAGARRSVRVVARSGKKKLMARTRSGYITAGEDK